MTKTTKNILFVDDDARVLEGLARGLRRMRDEWTMHFANSAEEALQLVKEEKIQVVITDMLMPGMNGAELLREVKECSPETLRVILSGEMGEHLSKEATSVADQCISKPCSPGRLQEVIERAWSQK